MLLQAPLVPSSQVKTSDLALSLHPSLLAMGSGCSRISKKASSSLPLSHEKRERGWYV